MFLFYPKQSNRSSECQKSNCWLENGVNVLTWCISIRFLLIWRAKILVNTLHNLWTKSEHSGHSGLVMTSKRRRPQHWRRRRGTVRRGLVVGRPPPSTSSTCTTTTQWSKCRNFVHDVEVISLILFSSGDRNWVPAQIEFVHPDQSNHGYCASASFTPTHSYMLCHVRTWVEI